LLDIKLVELSESVNYEALMKAESEFGIGAERSRITRRVDRGSNAQR